MSYDFHLASGDNGNVYQIVNNRDNNRTQNFTYDELNRIKTAATQGTTGLYCWGQRFGHMSGSTFVPGIDPWGNLKEITATQCNPLTLSQTVLANNRFSGMTYDAAGNLTNDGGGHTYTYDAENRLTTTAGWTYAYDGDGNRVKKTNGSTGTLYWTGVSSDPIAESSLSGTNQKEFIFFNGKRVARRDVTGSVVHYYFSDHLGSASVVTNAAGTMSPSPEEESDYYPYGGERAITDTLSDQNYKFTGKERDSESGLDDFGARYYASTMGRWITPDPINLTSARLVNPGNTLNKYVYAANNPLKYIDRDGEDITIFYRPPSGAKGDYGHILLGVLNQKTGQTGFLDYYPKSGADSLGRGAGAFNTGSMQERAEQAAAGKYAALTIQTSPDEAQKLLNQIANMTNGSVPDYSVLTNNCTTICEDVLHDLGLDFGDILPSDYWDDLYRHYSQDVANNPFKAFTFSPAPQKTGVEYGNPRYGFNSQRLFQLYFEQWSRQNNQPTPHITHKICWTDDKGKQHCQ